MSTPFTAADVRFIANARAQKRIYESQGRPVPHEIGFIMAKAAEIMNDYPDPGMVALFRRNVDREQLRIEGGMLKARDSAQQAAKADYDNKVSKEISRGLPGVHDSLDKNTLHKVARAAMVPALSIEDAQDPKKVEAHRKARTVRLPRSQSTSEALLSDQDKELVDALNARREKRAKEQAKANGEKYDPDAHRDLEITDDHVRRLSIEGAYQAHMQADIENGVVTRDSAPNGISREYREEAEEETAKYARELENEGLSLEGRVPLRQAVINAMDALEG